MIIFFYFDLIGDFYKIFLGGIFYLNFYYELFYLLIKYVVLINICIFWLILIFSDFFF